MSDAENFNDLISGVAERLTDEAHTAEYRFWEAPDILEEIRTRELPLAYFLSPIERREVREMISGLIGLFVRQHVGDLGAHQQLNIIKSFMFPKRYEVPDQVIDKLSKMYRSAHLERAWELRRLMYEISELVVPVRANSENIFKIPVKLKPEANPNHPLYELVSSRLKNLKRHTTMQMLAIHIYLHIAHKTGKTGIDERSLKRDMQKLRRWEEADKEHLRVKAQLATNNSGMSWKAEIPIRKYSESWVPKVTQNDKDEDADFIEHIDDD